MAAIRLSRELQEAQRPPSKAEQATLARWSSWGAVPQVFDTTGKYPQWAAERAELKALLEPSAYDEASRTTLNAHYTDPAYVREIWSAVARLGFREGNVLEPGSGLGTFIGLAPAGARVTGVELDSTTAAIASSLYPHATIRSESFVDTRFPSNHFDAVVGNVPFSDVPLHDPRHNAGSHSMHNHFIIKSLDLTRPGGVVAVLTSHWTLDAQNPAARREMNAKADLLGAVRLPSGAHRRSAGTEALTDLLIFRRRDDGVPPASQLWETVTARQIDGELVKINSYFDWKPEHILGELHVGTGMYGSATLSVVAPLEQTTSRLAAALEGVTEDAVLRGDTVTDRPEALTRARAARIPAAADEWDGTITARPDGTFTVVRDAGHEPFAVPKSGAAELRHLVRLRDGATGLLAAEAASVDDTAETDALRQALRSDYLDYRRRYGPLNRFSLRSTGRVDPETGETGMARITPRPVALFRADPFKPLVMALEDFDEETQAARPAGILKHRVVTRRPVVQGAETPAEAIAISLDQTGGVDLETIAHLLGNTPAEARAALGELVYDDPTSGKIIHAAEYLSGDVRGKLADAITAAEQTPELAVNVAALRRVLPEQVGVEDIRPRLGAVWIDAATHQQFLREILRDNSLVVENPLGGTWEVKGQRGTLKARSEWGTERRSAPEIAKALLEQKTLIVTDEIKNGDSVRRVVNPIETAAAQEKGEALQARFAEWVWEDSERAVRLVDEYNRRFNSIVLRDYSTEGDHLSLPGMAATFTPPPHQRAAVARMISEPAVGLFHQVGAGKTAEMVMGTMELGRMGLVSKPAVVVPNHMLEQFGREWMQIYPQAKILAASSDDLAGEKRRLFVARAAANDWDAIIMTRTAFERIRLSPDAQAEYISTQVDELRTVVESLDKENSLSVKQLEKKLLSLEQDVKSKLDAPKDPGISFESTGIDYLVIDEMHDFKNLATVSNIDGASIAGSNRATDLHMKLEWLRAQHGSRVVTAATATPLANSITEAHVMQRYLRPDLLKAAGVSNFDAWAATFGMTVTDMEMAPTGGAKFRLKTRFAKFQNVPEMLRMWHVFADVKTAEDLNLPVPLVRRRPDGERLPENVVIAPGEQLQAYIEDIGRRAEAVANRVVTPEEDNMLNISTDGRKAALDMRMVGGTKQPEPSKLDAMAAKIKERWDETKNNVYVDRDTGRESPARGGLQLVFLDLGTPSATRWNAYDELKHLLTQQGMPAGAIRFIHEARNDAEKARMFASARSGHIAVLVGSTSKMGVGTNVQTRITDLHHGDCPWRPADLEQRDGRGLRQGNQNAEIGLYRYATERSFDTYMWQTVERKAKFINQILRGKLDSREIEDIGDAALGAAEMKAITSGNPLLLEKAEADNDHQRLQRLERAHHRAQTILAATRQQASAQIDKADVDLSLLREALGRTTDVAGEAFAMTVGSTTYTSRADAGRAVTEWAANSGARWVSAYENRKIGTLGEIAGHTVDVATTPGANQQPFIVLSLREIPHSTIQLGRDAFLEGGAGLVRQLENRATGIPRAIDTVERTKHEAQAVIEESETRLGLPFRYAAELAAAAARLDAVNASLADELTDRYAEPEPSDSPADDARPAPALSEGGRKKEPNPDDQAARIEGIGRRVHDLIHGDTPGGPGDVDGAPIRPPSRLRP